ncbi:TyeA family type III secretion system gatekeeper subunit [Paraburkholderia sediminicola]|uniref:TyeA family type III secretion system gatekeeper subunit n=1 Tax=Paraburkholderia sediminicola TaxID=458836 RepID=UPI0038BA5E98
MATDTHAERRTETLMMGLFTFVDNARPAAFDLEKLANELGIGTPSARASFMNQMFTLVKQLPVQAYGSDRQRGAVIDAAQAALDQADMAADAANPEPGQT